MPKLPGVPHLAAIRALQKAGFESSDKASTWS